MADKSTPTADITRRCLLVAGTTSAALGLAGCASGDGGAEASDASPTTGGADSAQHAQPLSITQTDAQAAATLASCTRLDGHPMYHLTWEGAPAELGSPNDTNAAAQPTGFACTLFAAGDADGAPLVARNFDWEPGPASVVESTLDNGRRTVSVTDLRYVGVESESDLDDKKKAGGLTRAQAYSFDGINDAGVFIGLAADASARAEVVDGRSYIGGLGIQRMVLDHADTVDDAIELFDSYNIDFSGGPGLHYLLADSKGGKAVVEFDAGKLAVIRPPSGQPWMCLENFHMSSTTEDARSVHSRYTTCAKSLDSSRGKISVDDAFSLLDDVRQPQTQWQSVYSLAAGTLKVIGEKTHDYELSS